LQYRVPWSGLALSNNFDDLPIKCLTLP
jgi:hypothetical protein